MCPVVCKPCLRYEYLSFLFVLEYFWVVSHVVLSTVHHEVNSFLCFLYPPEFALSFIILTQQQIGSECAMKNYLSLRNKIEDGACIEDTVYVRLGPFLVLGSVRQKPRAIFMSRG